ncbi:MAG: molybdenum cofactor guanylyltransferase [Acidimicrobiia bacterium]|nr:molybdenum cofactor guanylyltransferase [Acidimicrobiia bacterium]
MGAERSFLTQEGANPGPLGVILAGGASTRMGVDKALVVLRGEPLVTHAARALEAVCGEVVVVGREGTLAGIECVPDDRLGPLGPAAGVATALRVSEGRPVLVVAVDQPFLRVETLAGLARQDRTTVPHDEVLQITCALYTPDVFDAVSRAVADGVPLWKAVKAGALIIDEPEWRSWGEDGRSWFSVDTPAALAEGLVRFG